MAHFVRRDGREWDRWVPYALIAYRALPHSSTGYSPNYFLYGREVTPPSESLVRPTTDEEIEPPVDRLQMRLRETYKEARERMERTWTQCTAQCNKRRKLRTLATGEMVYLHAPAVKPGHCKKFHCPWCGPHVVIERLSGVTYRLKLVSGQTAVVHVNRLKPAIVESTEEEQSAEQRSPAGNKDPEQKRKTRTKNIWQPEWERQCPAMRSLLKNSRPCQSG
ncbi:uncharacterized protein LOC106673488 [Cimex lectularius]|uniref:Integrase p58-like C-terminal domain-containing protein n=1 Tax=Cimex lectularius TaxID=79782 RepID=A0A8I6SBJ3_CIMLE|nr:uncharacterized protein LOC106673488 [Cimex lectularius]